jgi:clan AA aspartic protease
MIIGMVKSDEARIRLKVIGAEGQQQEVDVIIDSGFNGALTLPPALIETLGLRWRGVYRATLGDGSTCEFNVYVCKVLWDGKARTVLVAEADADSLVGMRLLRGYELKMQVRSRGKVVIKRLARR